MRQGLKRTLLVGLLALLCSFCLFADASSTTSYTDSFAFLSSYPQYVELYEAINNYDSASEVEAKFESLKTSLGNTVQDWTVLLKASLNYAHYCLEIAEKKNTKKAKQLISNAEAIYEALEKSGLDMKASGAEALKFCCLSIGYLASPLSISKGLESVKVIDNAYKENPQELSIAILYAARKLNAPGIGGGDDEEAYEVFSLLLNYVEAPEGAKTADWDRFDIYCGLAKYYEKKGSNEQAVEMYAKALVIYPQNGSVTTAIAKLEKK